MQNDIKALVGEFFDKLNIKIDSLKVNNVEESNIYNIKIETEESGLLIGPNGKNLNVIENILKLMSSKKIGERIKLHIEVNDYIKTKDDRLFDFIKSKIRFIEKTGKDVQLPFYSSYERKKIHGFVSEMGKKSIYTKSIGEGKERRLYICKQEQKLTIDIDGDDI
ncbi:MAG: R3H domain-containing nucleic acid-binding protein [Candidatus Gracilibacteria bacterium]